ncbi:hypothetical protein PAMP_011372 [Pampus punctatissimus]
MEAELKTDWDKCSALMINGQVALPYDDNSVKDIVHHLHRLMYYSLALHLCFCPLSVQHTQYLITGHLGPDCSTRWIKQEPLRLQSTEYFLAGQCEQRPGREREKERPGERDKMVTGPAEEQDEQHMNLLKEKVEENEARLEE